MDDAADNLKTVLKECGNRVFFIEKNLLNRVQILHLLDIVNRIGGSLYRNALSSKIDEMAKRLVEEADRIERGEGPRREHVDEEDLYQRRQELYDGRWDRKVLRVVISPLKALWRLVKGVFSAVFWQP